MLLTTGKDRQLTSELKQPSTASYIRIAPGKILPLTATMHGIPSLRHHLAKAGSLNGSALLIVIPLVGH